jgi:uncharacterized repeat protein (TIGR01451 family)
MLRLVQFIKVIPVLLVISVVLVSATRAQVCGTAGKDGPGGTIGGVINTYYPGSGNASAGSTSITVGAISNLSSATTTIVPGDLLLIIQMQDAAINSTNTSAYGANNGTGAGYTSLNKAGLYEYAVSRSTIGTGGGTITLQSALINSYSAGNVNTATGQGQQRFQVIRVPQYSTATLSSTLTAAPWDGASGGILVFDVAGALTLGSATVSVNGRGFRGGGIRQLNGDTGGANTDYVQPATKNFGGSKGEGIVGTPRYVYDGTAVTDLGVENYPNGSLTRGAPGNAGGGGADGNPAANDQNPGGGGGANGGTGGRGGFTWNTVLDSGGRGGAMFPATAGRVTLGGGGGAATRNNSSGNDGSGGGGGGIVMIRAGSFSGNGTITANGTNGLSALNDGGGGGGAGGSVVILANSGGPGGLAVSARGGNGGNAWPTQAPGTAGEFTPGGANNRHGPGGGGGGGVVILNFGLAPDVSGGVNGTTTTANNAFGATAGSVGAVTTTLTSTQIPGAGPGATCFPALTVTKSTSTPARTPGSRADYTITVVNAATAGWAMSVAISDALPGGGNFTFRQNLSITLSGGATRPSTSNPSSGDTNPTWSSFTLPPGGQVQIVFRVNILAATLPGIYQNPATATYPDPVRTTTTATVSASYDPASSTNEDVAVSAPNLTLVKACMAPANCVTQAQTPMTELSYQITYTNIGSAGARNLILLDQIPVNTDFKVGSAAQNPGSTGLTIVIEYSSDYNPAAPGSATWTYTPVSGGGGAPAGFDRNVKAVRWRATAPAGGLSQTAPNNTGNISFIVRIR